MQRIVARVVHSTYAKEKVQTYEHHTKHKWVRAYGGFRTALLYQTWDLSSFCLRLSIHQWWWLVTMWIKVKSACSRDKYDLRSVLLQHGDVNDMSVDDASLREAKADAYNQVQRIHFSSHIGWNWELPGILKEYTYFSKDDCKCIPRVRGGCSITVHAVTVRSIALLHTMQNVTYLAEWQFRSKEVILPKRTAVRS